MIRDVAIVAEELPAARDECIENARADCEGSERVAKAGMFGGREREIRKPELSQTAKTLHDRKIEQPCLRCG